MRSLVSVVRGDGYFLDPEAPLGGHQNHFPIEMEGVAQAVKRNAFQRPSRVKHVAAVVLTHRKPKGEVLDRRERLVGDELVEWHSSSKRTAVQHTRPLDQVGLIVLERSEQLGQ